MVSALSCVDQWNYRLNNLCYKYTTHQPQSPQHSHLRNHKLDPSSQHHVSPSSHWRSPRAHLCLPAHWDKPAKSPPVFYLHQFSFRQHCLRAERYHRSAERQNDAFSVHGRWLHVLPQTLPVGFYQVFFWLNLFLICQFALPGLGRTFADILAPNHWFL